ncbi:MAG: N-acetylmuramic acid 6-phosphate etherase [Candidatus Bathyarchaeota archaeon]|nr:N-acetylmuramic acid 6-phosphate etherase [Candidatus Bathyarchaeota archaeon]
MSRTTEQLNPASKGIDEKPIREILEIINTEDSKIAEAIRKELPQIEKAVEAIVNTVKSDGRVFLMGAGTSGRLCILEASEIPPTFGIDPEVIQGVIAGGLDALHGSVETAEDQSNKAWSDLQSRGFNQRDLLMALSASGSTPYVLGAVKAAKEIKAKTIGVACNKGTPLGELADISVELIVGPEVVAGSTRMKAGTAQKMVLNMMNTSAMAKLGLIHDGYMVGVQASNIKLMDRSTRIVSNIAEISYEEARKALEITKYDVRVALLYVMTGMTIDEARTALSDWRSVRDVLRKKGGNVE